MWFHVDAAYGGPFALTDRGKQVLAGLELADSIVIDPHKLLFMPYGIGAVLVRNKATLLNSYRGCKHPYIEGGTSDDELYHRSPELTKPFRAMRLWLTLQIVGEGVIRTALDERLSLASYAYQQLTMNSRLKLGPAPDLSIAVFQYLPPHLRGQQEILDSDPVVCNATQELLKILRDQFPQVLLTPAVLNDASTGTERYFIRFAICSFRTHLEHVNRQLQVIDQAASILDRKYLGNES
jgi:glutamate/tyrosine decarboxylase-like PLP-dependent enzyme